MCFGNIIENPNFLFFVLPLKKMASTAHRSRMSLGLLLKVIVFVTLIKEMKGEPESFLEKRGPSLFYEAHLAVFVNSEDFILLKDVKKKRAKLYRSQTSSSSSNKNRHTKTTTKKKHPTIARERKQCLYQLVG